MSNSNTTQGNKDSMPKSEKSGVGGQSGSQHGGQGGQQGGQQQGGQQGGQQPNRGGREGRANGRRSGRQESRQTGRYESGRPQLRGGPRSQAGLGGRDLWAGAIAGPLSKSKSIGRPAGFLRELELAVPPCTP